jgi:DHA1 family inner membrane transport protein
MGLLQEIATSLSVSIPSAGHFITAYALGVSIGAPVLAILGAKLPRKYLLIGLMLFYGVANYLTAYADSAATMLLSRFVAGLPHGAYFGIASLVAAELAGSHRRGSAIAFVMMGLTIANVIGVPFATWLGQTYGWRISFEFSAFIALLTMISISVFVPNIRTSANSSFRSELAGFKNIHMWLTLAVGAIGFGGMFSVYSYISPILTNYTGVGIHSVPVALAIFGGGMVAGGVVAGWLADKHLNRTVFAVLISSAIAFVIAALSMADFYTAIIGLFLIGFTLMGLSNVLQTRLIDVSGEAQGLAASLNHSAFNVANALGAFLGGAVIAQQLGWLAPIWIGVGLSLVGLIIFKIALSVEKNATT